MYSVAMAAPRQWSPSEVDVIVGDYLDMLALELRGETFNKAARNREIRKRLDSRSHGAVERKHMNISAVLISLGLPYVDGYKPLGNVQDMLRQAVRAQSQQVEDLVREEVAAAQTPIAVDDVLGILVEAPKASSLEARDEHRAYALAGGPSQSINHLEREAANQSLGDAGEALVVQYECARLRHYGKDHLARNVEQVSKTIGDHAGYDIRSYEVSGHDRLIEVKTTRYAKLTPFYISAAEVRFSEARQDAYQLYRVFEFRERPKLFTLPGRIERHVRLEAVNYSARF